MMYFCYFEVRVSFIFSLSVTGIEKRSLEAVAAHARDKHVWRHGANFGQIKDRKSD